jgi:hypothetical protein
VKLLAMGTCSIQATQMGNADYAAAPPVAQSFQVTLAIQAGNFMPPADVGYIWSSHGRGVSDDYGVAVPAPPSATLANIDSSGGNSGASLGCVTNGTFVACKVSTIAPHIRIYDQNLQMVCSEASAVPPFATSTNVSVPIIAGDGSIFIADSAFATRISSTCTVVWQTAVTTDVGALSTKVTPAGDYLTIIGRSGPLTLYNASTGAQIGRPLYVSTSAGGGNSGNFYSDTNDVAAVPGAAAGGTVGGPNVLQRLYYVGQNVTLSQPNNQLFGVDVSAAGLSVESWSAPFYGPSQATPMWNNGTIFTDMCSQDCSGTGNPGPGIGAFADNYPVATLSMVFSVTGLPSYIDANFPFVPGPGAGCFVTGYFGSSAFDCRNPATGATSGGPPEFSIDLDGIIPGEAGTIAPVGDRTVTTDGAGHYVLLVGLKALTSGNGYAAAIRLDNQSLLWSYPLPNNPGNTAPGQFPLLNGTLGSEVCFSSSNSGPQCIGPGQAGQ